MLITRITWLFFLALLAVQPLRAEQDIALLISQDEAERFAVEDTAALIEAGIKTLYIEGRISPSLLQQLSESGFELTGVLPFRYMHGRAADRLTGEAETIAEYWLSYFQDSGYKGEIILGIHPDIQHPAVQEFFTELSSEFLSRDSGLDLFLISRQHEFAPGEVQLIPQWKSTLPQFSRQLLPAVEGPNAIRILRDIFRENEVSGQKSLIMDYSDFRRYMNYEQWLIPMLNSVNRGETDAIAVPAHQPESPPVRPSVILLLVLWLSFSINYRFNPNYNQTVVRYFLSHEFMVDDILNRRIIMRVSTVVMMLQTALLCGITFSIGITALTDTPGHQALGYYYSMLATDAGLFMFFFIAGLLFSLISWLWLVVCCFRQDILSQAATLMLWHMHLAFPLVTLLVTFVLAGLPSWLTAGLMATFALFQLSGFYIAAVRFARMPTFSPGLHYLFTIVLYTLFLAGLGYSLYVYSDFYDVMRLALNI